MSEKTDDSLMKRKLKLSPIESITLATGALFIALFTAHSVASTSPFRAGGLRAVPAPLFAAPASLPLTVFAEIPVITPFHMLTPVVLDTMSYSMPMNALNSAATSGNDAPLPGSPGVLDQRRQFALGMIETGNRDAEVGGAGEVSRYQIMPSVWQRYSDSRDYLDQQVSLDVAQQHWTKLYKMFKQQAGREPKDFDMYVLWNTHYGYYAARGFDPARLGPNVRDRAQRYVNLVEDAQNGL